MLIIIGTSHSGGYNHSSVVYGLKNCGYRLIDTAKRYGVEELLSYAIKVCTVCSLIAGTVYLFLES